jgi:hypothetical protein
MEKSITDDLFEKVEDGEGDYFDIMEIKEKDGKVVTADDIEKNKDGSIAIKDITAICYCANDFFYWDSLPDFEGKNINKLEEQKTYEKENEGSGVVETGKTKSLKGNRWMTATIHFLITKRGIFGSSLWIPVTSSMLVKDWMSRCLR